jgi:pimeloyl-ACP methyl ester carboxylesterase
MTTIRYVGPVRRRWPFRIGLGLSALLAVSTIFAVLLSAFETEGQEYDPSFYQPSNASLKGVPGSIIRSEPMPFAPAGADAYRILYRSTGLHGEAIAVSGVLVVPRGGENRHRPIVAWAHPTTGVTTGCAPSLRNTVYRQIQGLNEMLQDGFAVVATDYPGLGGPGIHPYLIGDSEGRAVLDSVRASAHLLDVENAPRFVVWGHSQGGQAALYTGLLASNYAPELKLMGVAAAAPATDLPRLMRDDFSTSGGKGITALTLSSWSRLFDIPLEPLVAPSAVPTMDRLASGCIETIFDLLERRMEERPLGHTFLTISDLSAAEPWNRILEQNSPPAVPRKYPVFIAQGLSDDIVRPEVTAAYVRGLCSNGNDVDYLTIKNVGHGFVAHDAAAEAVAWIRDRFDGISAPSGCTVGSGSDNATADIRPTVDERPGAEAQP